MQSKRSGKMKLPISRIQNTFILKPGLKVRIPEIFSISQLGKKNIFIFLLILLNAKRD